MPKKSCPVVYCYTLYEMDDTSWTYRSTELLGLRVRLFWSDTDSFWINGGSGSVFKKGQIWILSDIQTKNPSKINLNLFTLFFELGHLFQNLVVMGMGVIGI